MFRDLIQSIYYTNRVFFRLIIIYKSESCLATSFLWGFS